MDRVIKVLFFLLLVKPIVFFMLGLNLRGRHHLPVSGPAVLVANHNSHLDTLVIMSLYPLSKIHKIRPIGAADYFLKKGGVLKWIATKCIDIIPFQRAGGVRENLFIECHQALDNDDILIFFPEGSRGQPEALGKIKKGIYYMLKENNNVPVIPIMTHGLGRALPKGEALFVPFNCDIIIGKPIDNKGSSTELVNQINNAFQALSAHCITKNSD